MNEPGSGEEGLLDNILREQVKCMDVAPTYESIGAAGADLRYNGKVSMLIHPGERLLIPTGVKIALRSGTCALVCPRSGLAVKKGITVLNGPGIIDSDYRGEIKVPLINFSNVVHTIESGERIAQLVVIEFVPCAFIMTEELTATARGEGGFGSTDKKD